VDRCGAMHVATRADEMRVLAEFHDRHRDAGYGCRLLTGDQAAAAAPGVRGDRVVGALRSDLELCVDPREAIKSLPGVLALRGVETRFGQHVRCVTPGSVELSDGTAIGAGRVVVCSGAEMRTLFPVELSQA